MTRLLPLALLLACAPTGDKAGPHHPDGYDAADVHGPAAKLQEESCVECHGDDLKGGTSGVSCDTCHQADWRTTCTYCHGGGDNTTGAPPMDIDGTTDAAATSFPEHTAHVTTNIHTAFDCVQCHVKPVDVLTPGHIFVDDTTPGVAEVHFGQGLSSAGTYDGAGGCSNLYCHGSGQGDDGEAHSGDDFSACDSCHASADSRNTAWYHMSGEHARHLMEGLDCQECHSTTLDDAGDLADPSLHVNGVADVQLPDGMERDENGRCTGTCHREEHNRRTW